MEGYTFISTFWMDFSIADVFGPDAIIDTFNRAFKEWKNDYKMLTELVLVLNWKIWQHYDKGNHPIAKVYNGLWEKSAQYAERHLTGIEFEYYFNVTD